jgi:hypothetical protein
MIFFHTSRGIVTLGEQRIASLAGAVLYAPKGVWHRRREHRTGRAHLVRRLLTAGLRAVLQCPSGITRGLSTASASTAVSPMRSWPFAERQSTGGGGVIGEGISARLPPE